MATTRRRRKSKREEATEHLGKKTPLLIKLDTGFENLWSQRFPREKLFATVELIQYL